MPFEVYMNVVYQFKLTIIPFSIYKKGVRHYDALRLVLAEKGSPLPGKTAERLENDIPYSGTN